jgi:pimeloyl-ACP methyl ester carboxylesterase
MGMRANINGAELRIDTFGDPADPAVLLIMGGAASMDRWEEPFCARLADAGRFVIRYDHRDTGESTSYPPGEPGYTSDDLVADAFGVLDACAVPRAHVVGMSMGGALAQQLAVEHPERVRSLVLMSTSIAASGGPELPGMSDELRALFNGNGPAPPDWTDRDAAIEYLLEVERPYAGARGIDDDAMRALLARTYDRASSPASADNHFMAGGSTFPIERLAAVSAPTLVIHGTHDPLFPLAHGEALERTIPDARLLVVDGLGHEFPRWAWDEVLPALIVHTA